ncbi:hypothetical protein [Paenibacillus paridis]|uniref:hypothetical protein n=1 Tax=Paenibacillus paridis TaxID=2583376 RepID=UPI001120DE2C|nr:hypothetical protein [Paenibacillus paridis]
MTDKKTELSYGAQIRRNSLRVLLGVIILLLIFVAIAYIVNNKGSQTASTVPSTAFTQKSVIAIDSTPEPTIEPTEEPVDWSTADFTEENAMKALKQAKAGLSIEVTDETVKEIHTNVNDIVITLNAFDTLNEKAYLRKMGESMIAYSRVLFTNSQVERVVLNNSVNTTDGGSAFGVQIVWNRSTNDSINYDALLKEAQTNAAAPYKAGESFTVKPFILDALNEDVRSKFE